MPAWTWIALGGAGGALARYYLGAWITKRASAWVAAPVLQAPIGTFAVNVAGAFLLGLVASLAVTRSELMTHELRLLLAVGFCGAFTTYSAFSLETWAMIEKGHVAEAAAYVVASNAIALLAVFGGASLARAL